MFHTSLGTKGCSPGGSSLLKHLTKTILVITLLAMFAQKADAEANDLFALGIGTGMVYTSAPGHTDVSATAFHFNIRVKMLYFLAVDLMMSPGSSSFDNGQPKPRFRLSALIYLVNSRWFSLYVGGGMLAASFGDIIDWQAPTTYVRAGGGLEFTYDGHYGLSVESYWLVPGLGVVNRNINSTLGSTGQLPAMEDAAPVNGYEIVASVRYFF